MAQGPRLKAQGRRSMAQRPGLRRKGQLMAQGPGLKRKGQSMAQGASQWPSKRHDKSIAQWPSLWRKGRI